MKNDREIKRVLKLVKNDIDEYLAMPNPDAYSDSILDMIIKHLEKLKELHETNHA